MLKSKPLPDEIFPVHINHVHGGSTERLTTPGQTVYQVHGEIFDVKNNTNFRFEKEFWTEKSALAYQKAMSETYPISESIVKEVTSQEVSLYV